MTQWLAWRRGLTESASTSGRWITAAETTAMVTQAPTRMLTATTTSRVPTV